MGLLLPYFKFIFFGWFVQGHHSGVVYCELVAEGKMTGGKIFELGSIFKGDVTFFGSCWRLF
jgi:hypothetical protein